MREYIEPRVDQARRELQADGTPPRQPVATNVGVGAAVATIVVIVLGVYVDDETARAAGQAVAVLIPVGVAVWRAIRRNGGAWSPASVLEVLDEVAAEIQDRVQAAVEEAEEAERQQVHEEIHVLAALEEKPPPATPIIETVTGEILAPAVTVTASPAAAPNAFGDYGEAEATGPNVERFATMDEWLAAMPHEDPEIDDHGDPSDFDIRPDIEPLPPWES